jgi:hypothetical protein
MKKIAILLFTFCFLTTYGQRLVEGNLNVLKNEKTINVVFDYSNVVFRFDDSEEETRYVERKVIEEGEQWRTEWETTKTNIKSGILYPEFIKEFNLELFDNNCPLKGGNYVDANYTMIVVMKVICTGKNAGPASDDPYIEASVIIKKTGTDDIIAKIDIKRTTGKPFSNTIGRIETVYENIGEDLGEFFAKNINK